MHRFPRASRPQLRPNRTGIWRQLPYYATAVTALLLGCNAKDSPTPEADSINPNALFIQPGVGIGAVHVEMAYREFSSIVGEPSDVFGYEHQVTAKFPDYGIETIFGSGAPTSISDDAVLYGLGTLSSGTYAGEIVPGMTKAEVVQKRGETIDQHEGFAYYPAGFAVHYDDNDKVDRVTICRPYEIRQEPPPMEPARTTIGDSDR